MSRIGKLPIILPKGVTAQIKGDILEVKGPKGLLQQTIHKRIKATLSDGKLLLERSSDNKQDKSLHGLMRSLAYNMVKGVTDGYQKNLELVGIGYRAALSGSKLTLSVGYSHPVIYEAPAGIQFELDGRGGIIVKGIDKQLVGQVAAEIRAVKKPEPYRGKGIKYSVEKIRRKAGKVAGK